MKKNIKDHDEFNYNLKSVLKIAFSYASSYKIKLIFVFIISILLVLAALAPESIFYNFQEILSGAKKPISNTSKLGSISIILAGITLFSLFTQILAYYSSLILQNIGTDIVLDVREKVFRRIQDFSYTNLNKIPIGKLVTRACNNTEQVQDFYTYLLVDFFVNMLTLITIFVIIATYSIHAALYISIIIPIVILIIFLFQKFSKKAYDNTNEANTKLNTFLSENISGIKITQVFNQENKKIYEFKKISKELRNCYIKEITIHSIFRPLIYVLKFLTLSYMFYISIKLVEAGNIKAGLITTLYLLLSSFYNPIDWVSEQFIQFQNTATAFNKVLTVLKTDIEPKYIQGKIKDRKLNFHIEFKDVWFKYTKDTWVLKGISFEVLPGQTVSFVGSTGSGKTTILSLITRNYDIQKGQILIDGIDIKEYDISFLRQQVGQMLQDVFLFNDTIKNNITLRNPNIKDEDIKEAVEYVGCKDMIEKLDKQYDFLVNERGNNFSQGQRQLISFARTISYKPNLLILDEATANIDSETEIIIKKSLRKMMKDHTMLMVAHRLSTIQESDKIIVLSKGQIIEQGNHQELLKNKKHYYKLYNLQYEQNKN